MPRNPATRHLAFTLVDQHCATVKLADFKGTKVLVSFYPENTRS